MVSPVAVSSLPAGDIRSIARRLPFSKEQFKVDVPFQDLDRLAVFFRAYRPSAAGAVLWIGHNAIATVTLFDRGYQWDAVDRFHQGLTYLAAREKGRPQVIAKRKLPKQRPALFVVAMHRGDITALPSLQAFCRALMAAYLGRHDPVVDVRS